MIDHSRPALALLESFSNSSLIDNVSRWGNLMRLGVIYDRGRRHLDYLYIVVLQHVSLYSYPPLSSNMAKLLKKPLKLACVQLSTGMPNTTQVLAVNV